MKIYDEILIPKRKTQSLVMNDKPGGVFHWWYLRFKSFVYAFNGIIAFLKSGPHAQIHLAATVIVAALSVFFGLTKMEIIVICFSVGFVWITEMINTAIEKTMDFITLKKHEEIRIIKDIASGSVLVASIVAVIAGLIIFIPKFLSI
jgi:diacylglycerol kinase (ATP)